MTRTRQNRQGPPDELGSVQTLHRGLIASAARASAHAEGIGLLVVDYVQLVETEQARVLWTPLASRGPGITAAAQ
uniref:hypothetical protein n=1 Tax=Streptomyces cellulosae TaxID=1968 RepID=UPI002F90E492